MYAAHVRTVKFDKMFQRVPIANTIARTDVLKVRDPLSSAIVYFLVAEYWAKSYTSSAEFQNGE
jgi:hypothetical protein